MDSIQPLRTTLAAFTLCLAIGALATSASHAIGAIGENTAPNASVTAPNAQAEALPALMLKDALVLEDREGFNSEYIFGMTKAILNSTMHPAVKPMPCLVTVPLDLVFLPFTLLLGAL